MTALNVVPNPPERESNERHLTAVSADHSGKYLACCRTDFNDTESIVLYDWSQRQYQPKTIEPMTPVRLSCGLFVRRFSPILRHYTVQTRRRYVSLQSLTAQSSHWHGLADVAVRSVEPAIRRRREIQGTLNGRFAGHNCRLCNALSGPEPRRSRRAIAAPPPGSATWVTDVHRSYGNVRDRLTSAQIKQKPSQSLSSKTPRRSEKLWRRAMRDMKKVAPFCPKGRPREKGATGSLLMVAAALACSGAAMFVRAALKTLGQISSDAIQATALLRRPPSTGAAPLQ